MLLVAGAPMVLAQPQPVLLGGGYAVAIDGRIAVVGNAAGGVKGDGGTATIFEKQRGMWVKVLSVSGSNNSTLGAAADVDGQRLVIGAPGGGNEPGCCGPWASGHVRTYVKQGGSWALESTLRRPGGAFLGDSFGRDVALDDGWLLVRSVASAHFQGSGRVDFFRLRGTSWVHEKTVTVARHSPANLAIDGDTAVIDNRVFELSQGQWSQTQDLGVRGPVALRGGIMMLGQPRRSAGTGHVLVFERQPWGWWSQTGVIDPLAPVAGFGTSVAFIGSTGAMVGAEHANNRRGEVVLFFRDAGDWVEHSSLESPSSRSSDRFGFRVAFAESTALVVAAGRGGSRPQHRGFAYLFEPIDLSLAVAMDVQPRDALNQVGNRRGIDVVIFSKSGFDAVNDIDRTTLRFGKRGDEESLQRCSTSRSKDFDGDGRDDLSCVFEFEESGLGPGDSKAKLTGQKKTGRFFKGAADVTVVGCRGC